MITLKLPAERHTSALGRVLAGVLRQMEQGAAIALHGELGAGKTTLARALIHALGYSGPVVSPSYTLVEPYDFGNRRLLHLDLYRIAGPEELEYLGWREWHGMRDWMLVEWPENGAGFLPDFDLQIHLQYAGDGRCVELAGSGACGSQLLRLTQEQWIQDSAEF